MTAAGSRALHQGQPVLAAGAPASAARGAAVLVHGRGGSAAGILGVAALLGRQDLALRAPQAAGDSWYPLPFLAPLEHNEPYLSSALARLGEVMAGLAEEGIPAERTLLVGFSQGACLTLEWVARNPGLYAGVAGLAGGLIGPPGTPRDYPGSLHSTPVFLGCGDPDPHIPRQRVEETARVLDGMGARVTTRLYPGLGHGINEDEADALGQLASAL
jgi:predicted esterase